MLGGDVAFAYISHKYYHLGVTVCSTYEGSQNSKEWLLAYVQMRISNTCEALIGSQFQSPTTRIARQHDISFQYAGTYRRGRTLCILCPLIELAGWGTKLTPQRPVLVLGYCHARTIYLGVFSPLVSEASREPRKGNVHMWMSLCCVLNIVIT